MTAAKLRLVQAGLANRDTKVSTLCKELEVSRQTLYRFVSPKGELWPIALKLLGASRGKLHKKWRRRDRDCH
jgi:hypothetical protein